MSFEAPKREDQLLPANYIFHNAREMYSSPKADDMILPDGYVFPEDRVYPIAPNINLTGVTVFNNFLDSFVGEFQPQQVVYEIPKKKAVKSGGKLHKNGYKMVMGALINQNDDSRTVAEILNMDFDCSNARIIEYLENGSKIGPFIMGLTTKKRILRRPKTEYFCASGVGLWMSTQQIELLSE